MAQGTNILRAADFWAITPYYTFDDPVGKKRRLQVFREFRRHLQVPLAAIELSLDGDFDLQAQDAELLIQLSGGAMIWQKERLLNVALRSLPDGCDAVAWIDCDVVLPRDDWAAAARRLLDDCRLVQPFRNVYFLPRDAQPGNGVDLLHSEPHSAAAYRLSAGTIPDEYFHLRGGTGIRFKCAAGMAWVARRKTLEQHGLYDAMIMGGGDRAVFVAACGRHSDFARAYGMNPRQRKHYEEWATRFSEAVQGRVGYLDGDALHLWHGDISSRHYADRYSGFEQFLFDPDRDIIQNRDEVWCWNSAKPELHEYVRRYFDRRGGRP